MLRIREITLAGFGIYEEPTRFLLPSDGPAVLWGANETGKSTFLWGVASTWFGLPQSADPTRVGTSRFRSLSRPAEFWGELVWERAGRVYRLRRDFDTHRVHFTEETEQGRVEIFHGDHNPAARSSSGSAFPEQLAESIGLGQLDLFLQTFCLTQPFGGDAEIESELQHLISGSRAVKVDDVLGALFAEIKALTRTTGDLGLVRPGTSRPTNQREDGRLDALQSELARARLDLELGRKHLEQIHAEGLGVSELETSIAALRASLEERARRLQVLARWSELHEERARRTETVRRLEGSVSALKELERRLEAIAREASPRDAAFDGAPEDLAERLETLERVDREREREESEGTALQSERDSLETQVRTLRQRLETEFADFRGRRDWLDVRNRLREAVARAEREDAEIERMRTEAERREKDLEATASLDGIVVQSLRTFAESVLESHERVVRIEGRLAELRAQSEDRGYLAAQDRMELLAENLRLENELRECSTQLREQRAAVVLARDAFDQAMESAEVGAAAPAGALAPGVPSAHDAAGPGNESESEQPRNVGADAVGPATHPKGAVPILSGALGTALTCVLAFGLAWSWPIALGAGAVASALLWWGFRVRSRRGIAKARPSRRTDLTPGEKLRRHLRETATPTPSADRRTQPDPAEAETALAEAEARLAEIKKRERALENRLAEIRGELGPYASTTASELARMEERWKHLDEQLDALNAERVEILEEKFGTPDDPDWRSVPVSETKETLEALLLLPGGPSPEDEPSLGELLDWLGRLDDADWEAFQDAETARADARNELQEVRVRCQHAEEKRGDRSEIAELERRLQPFTLETDPKWLLTQQEECMELERQLARCESQLEAPRSRQSASTARASEVDSVWESLLQAWPALGGPEFDRPEGEPLHVWAARTRRDALAAMERNRRARSLREEEIPRILRTAGAATGDELESRLARESAALGQGVRELEELDRTSLGLTSPDAERTEERIDLLLKRRESELAAEKAEREELERKERELHAKLRERAVLEGKELPNLAALELGAQRMEEELTEARFRCDALVQAYRWMEEARDTYRATYRDTLAARIDHHFSRLTGVDGRRVELGDTFAVRVRDSEGRLVEPEQLSQGARDQLLLALRLGVADLLTDSVPLPFLFDDPFVHFDDERLDHLREGLAALGRDRQWILLTHRREMSSWADPIFTEALAERPLRSDSTAALPSAPEAAQSRDTLTAKTAEASPDDSAPRTFDLWGRS